MRFRFFNWKLNRNRFFILLATPTTKVPSALFTLFLQTHIHPIISFLFKFSFDFWNFSRFWNFILICKLLFFPPPWFLLFALQGHRRKSRCSDNPMIPSKQPKKATFFFFPWLTGDRSGAWTGGNAVLPTNHVWQWITWLIRPETAQRDSDGFRSHVCDPGNDNCAMKVSFVKRRFPVHFMKAFWWFATFILAFFSFLAPQLAGRAFLLMMTSAFARGGVDEGDKLGCKSCIRCCKGGKKTAFVLVAGFHFVMFSSWIINNKPPLRPPPTILTRPIGPHIERPNSEISFAAVTQFRPSPPLPPYYFF